jgi:hypothetical protein
MDTSFRQPLQAKGIPCYTSARTYFTSLQHNSETLQRISNIDAIDFKPLQPAALNQPQCAV